MGDDSGPEPLEATGKSARFRPARHPITTDCRQYSDFPPRNRIGGVLRRGLGLHSDGRSEETLFRISIERTGEVKMGRPPPEISMRMR